MTTLENAINEAIKEKKDGFIMAIPETKTIDDKEFVDLVSALYDYSISLDMARKIRESDNYESSICIVWDDSEKSELLEECETGIKQLIGGYGWKGISGYKFIAE